MGAPGDNRPRVVIVGGGFGGIYAAKALRTAPVEITLIDKKNHHVFQPLLYQVATAGLSAPNIAAPIRRILRRQSNTRVLMTSAESIDKSRRVVITSDGEIPYDYLIVATGAVSSYFGHADWEAHAPGLKTLEDAFEIRRRIFGAFEAAEKEPDENKRRALQTFVVIGGGPTGVELAGALSEICRKTLPSDFRQADPKTSRIILIEGTSQVLGVFGEQLAKKAKAQLERLGVEVMTNAQVTAIDAEGVTLGAERIEARTVLWAAGVSASTLGSSLAVETDRRGRVKVTPLLSVEGNPEVFVIGDAMSFEQDGQLVPGVAPAAIQTGRHAARNIVRAIQGKPALPFRYVDKGTMATIGRSAAVAMVGKLKLSGFIAWAAWLFVHILFLIGFRSRLLVMFEWIWAYFTYQRIARLILD